MLAAAQDADLVQNGAIFRAGENRFIVERAEKVFFGEETAYFWAIVQKAEGGIDGEFSQIMQIVAEQIKSASPQMEVVNAFPNAPRNNPQKENLAVMGIQKVSLQPIGFEDFCGESFQVRGKKAEVWVKVSFAARMRSSVGKAGRAY